MFLSTADRGKTKDVYGVSRMTTCIEGYLIIKGSDNHCGRAVCCQKLIDTGNGRGHVPLPEAVRFLSADLVRLKRMEYFSKAFFTRGEREGAELTCMIFLVTYNLNIKAVHLLTMVCRLPSLRWLSHQGLC
jgi:hypothetical protein